MRQLNIAGIVLALSLANTVYAACAYYPWGETNGNTCEGDDAGKTCYLFKVDSWDDADASLASIRE